MKIAVVGAGIAGLSCAWRLSAAHQVTLFEANDYFGGHTHTVEAKVDGLTHPVDTGFLVFNHRTYPLLTQLFETLGVATSAAQMTFSVQMEGRDGHGLEWAGTDLNSVFAQRRNLARPRFLRMLADLLRFNRMATALAAQPAESAELAQPLGQFLARHRFSAEFSDWYLLPMAAAIWSCPTKTMLAFPMATFVRFCHNHGLLQVTDRPQWYSVKGGARTYVQKLLQALPDARCNAAVTRVRRTAEGVEVVTAAGVERFDALVLACHSDQALALLDDASREEQRVLAAVPYQNNRAVLHTDRSLLPKRRRAWAAWNYACRQDEGAERSVCVHYLLNHLQPLPFATPLMVSLNTLRPPRAETVLAEFEYAHPVFDQRAVAAQAELARVQGQRHTWYAGAWTGYGFHEDGLRSGFAAAEAILAHARLGVAA